MQFHTRPPTALALLATLAAALVALTSSAQSTQADGLRALDGEWLFVDDRTDGQPLERWGPP
jgi:Spy/CpxP family protein refolding chaperone